MRRRRPPGRSWGFGAGLLAAVAALALLPGALRFGQRQSDDHQTSIDGPIHGVAVTADTGSVEVLRAGPEAGATVRSTRRFAWLAPRTTVRTVDGVFEVTAALPALFALVCTADHVLERRRRRMSAPADRASSAAASNTASIGDLMAQVSIRDLPDDVVERHRWRARRHGRSLEAELRAVLERTALLSREEFAAVTDAIADSTRGRWDGDSTDFLRADRRR